MTSCSQYVSHLYFLIVSLTFPATTELDGELLVHVLAQVKNVLFFRPLSTSTTTLSAAAATTSSSSIASATATPSSPECASLRHVVRLFCEIGR